MRILTPMTAIAAVLCCTGAANALGLENLETVSHPLHAYPVADALDFTSGVSETIDVGFGPSTGTLPGQSITVYVEVTGGTFSSVSPGPELIVPGGTSSLSQGGLTGQTSVSFIVTGADACAADTTAAGLETDCKLSLPLNLDGSDVTVSVGIETSGGSPIDNSSSENLVPLTVIQTAPAFQIAILADTTPTVADIAALNGAYTDFVGDNTIGTFGVVANTITHPVTAQTETVNSDFSGTDVAAANAGAVTFTLTGEQDAFDTMTGGTISTGTAGTITPDAETDIATGTLPFGSAAEISLIPDGEVPIVSSDYEVTVNVAAATSGPIQQAFSATGNLESVDRNGAAIVFPWTQSQSQGAASGTTSVYRIGNLSSSATSTVMAEVLNSSEAAYVNPGLVMLATSIPGDGEFVTNSRELETALGNFGRGDIAFYIEAVPSELTGRQFVVRNGDIQQVVGGTIEQDLN